MSFLGIGIERAINISLISGACISLGSLEYLLFSANTVTGKSTWSHPALAVREGITDLLNCKYSCFGLFYTLQQNVQ